MTDDKNLKTDKIHFTLRQYIHTHYVSTVQQLQSLTLSSGLSPLESVTRKQHKATGIVNRQGIQSANNKHHKMSKRP